MQTRRIIADPEIQDYLDGRLDAERRASLALEFQGDPVLKQQVQLLRLQNETLGMLGAEVLYEPVPKRLLDIVRDADDGMSTAAPVPRRFPSMVAMAVVVLLVFVCGIGAGWLGQRYLNPVPDSLALALSDVQSAYSFYAEDGFPIEFAADRESDFSQLITRSFGHRIGRPDLSPTGYQFMGGRFIPRAHSNTGLFLFSNDSGQRVTLFFWPSADRPQQHIQINQSDAISVRFWTTEGLGFAVISQRENGDLESVAQSIFDYYGSPGWR